MTLAEAARGRVSGVGRSVRVIAGGVSGGMMWVGAGCGAGCPGNNVGMGTVNPVYVIPP